MTNSTICGTILINEAVKVRVEMDIPGRNYISDYRYLEDTYFSLNTGDSDLLGQEGNFEDAMIKLSAYNGDNLVVGRMEFKITKGNSVNEINLKIQN
jgi:hypothetical protein